MPARILQLFTTFTAIILILNGCMFFTQSKMVFHPDANEIWNPAQDNYRYENVWLTTGSGKRVHGWFIRAPGAHKTVLFFHGNAGNITYRRDSILVFLRLGLDVLIMDYSGFGRSQGKPTESGLYEEARLAWQYLQKRGIPASRIVLFGRSLGGAVATELATRVKPDALILESTFTSARSQANAIFPVISWFVLLRYKFDSLSIIKRVQCPVLIVHSPDDEIIPFQHGVRLFKRANPPKFLLKLKGDHNYGFMRSQPQYRNGLKQFIFTHKLTTQK